MVHKQLPFSTISKRLERRGRVSQTCRQGLELASTYFERQRKFRFFGSTPSESLKPQPGSQDRFQVSFSLNTPIRLSQWAFGEWVSEPPGGVEPHYHRRAESVDCLCHGCPCVVETSLASRSAGLKKPLKKWPAGPRDSACVVFLWESNCVVKAKAYAKWAAERGESAQIREG